MVKKTRTEIPFWGRNISKVADPEEAQDVSTKNYVDTQGGSGSSYTAGENITIENNVISATNTTYNNFTGATDSINGTNGLVPAPVAGDEGKFLRGDGTWDTVSAGPTVVQTTGTSQTDVMSQVASSQLIYPSGEETSKTKIAIGYNAAIGSSENPMIAIGSQSQATKAEALALGNSTVASGSGSITIGARSTASANFAIAIGSGTGAANSQATNTNSIAIGTYAKTTRNNEFSIGDNTHTKYLTNITDPSFAQDAATKNYVDSFYPVGAVYSSTSSTVPTFAGGTWAEIGTQTIGSKTVHYYERTA